MLGCGEAKYHFEDLYSSILVGKDLCRKEIEERIYCWCRYLEERKSKAKGKMKLKLSVLSLPRLLHDDVGCA